MAATLFGGALARRFALPLVPILDADSPNYLWPALLKLNGAQFIHNAGLNFVYPGFLLFLLRVRSRLGWERQSLFFAGAVLVGLVFLVPEQLLARGDRLSKMFLPQTLFSVHAEIIREQMGEDLTSGLPISFPKPWLQTAYEELGAEIVRARVQSPQQFSLLGFNPDYLMNGESAILTRWLQQLGNDEELAKFLNYYFWRALQHRPGSFATKISRQMGVFYAWQCPAFIGYRRLPLVAWHYRHSLDVIKDPGNWEQLGKIPAGMPLLAQTEQLSDREIYFDSGKRLFFYHTLLARA